MRAFQRVLTDDSGQDLIEYALLISFIALVAAGAVSGVGQTIYDVFYNTLATKLFG